VSDLKAIEQLFPITLLITLQRMVLTFELVDEILTVETVDEIPKVAIQMKAIKHFFCRRFFYNTRSIK